MAVGNLEFIKSASSTASTVSVTDCFSDKYDVYQLIVTNYENTTGTTNYRMRLLDSVGSPITALEYDIATLIVDSSASFTETRNTGLDYIQYFPTNTSGLDIGLGTSIYVFNPNDSSSYTFLKWAGSSWFNTRLVGYNGIAVHKSAEQITGFQVFGSSGTMDNFAVSVYGVK